MYQWNGFAHLLEGRGLTLSHTCKSNNELGGFAGAAKNAFYTEYKLWVCYYKRFVLPCLCTHVHFIVCFISDEYFKALCSLKGSATIHVA